MNSPLHRPIQTAVIGFGLAGKYIHSPFLKTQPEHYHVTDILERTKSESKNLFPNASIVRSLDELLKKSELELVVITSPNDTHFSYAKAALETGKHVVIDKPFTIHSEEARELIDLSKKVKRTISVFQNRRYDADFLTIQEILAQHLLGDVHEFTARYDRYNPTIKLNAWREEDQPGCGVLYDLGAHIIDQAVYLFGLPQTITADVNQQRVGAKTPDQFDIRLDFGFTKAYLKSSMLVRELSPRYTINGTKGSFVKFGIDPQEDLLRKNQLPTDIENWGSEDPEIYGTLTTEMNNEKIYKRYSSKNGDYGLYYKNLFQTIRNGKELREKPEHGYNTIKLIELAMKSNAEKRSIVCEGLLPVKYS